MVLLNKHTKTTEERILKRVYYTKGTTVNLISQG